jgi:hypothetical protein
VTIGSADPKQRLQADAGRWVQLRLQDDSGVLQTLLPSGKTPEPIVLIVDASGKAWRRAQPVGTSGTRFSALVPKDSSYGFALANTDLAFSDANGSMVAANAFIPFASPLSGEASAQLKFFLRRDFGDPAVVIQVTGIR